MKVGKREKWKGLERWLYHWERGRERERLERRKSVEEIRGGCTIEGRELADVLMSHIGEGGESVKGQGSRQ